MTVEQLGDVRREFRPGLENLVAGIVIGLLMIGGGCFLIFLPANGVMESGGDLPFWRAKGEKGWCWGAAGLLAVLALVLIICGIFLIQAVRSLFSFRLCVAQNGFCVSDKKSNRIIGWADIVSVREIHLYERPPILKGVAKYLLPKIKSKSFVVTVSQGEPFVFDGNNVKWHLSLAEMIKEEAERRGIPWKVVEEHGY